MNFESLWQAAKANGILQKKEEFREFISFLRLNLNDYDNYLEIGTNCGGASAVFLQMFKNGYSIDLEPCPNMANLKRINPNFTQYNVDSHSTDTIETIKSLNIKFDMLFIDGDHSLTGCTMDYEYYRQFVKPDGIIVFHDIIANTTINNEYLEVYDFWESNKHKHCYTEIVNTTDFPDSIPLLNAHPIEKWGGIGIFHAKLCRQGIVITTHDKTKPFLNDLLQSLEGCPYPIVIRKNTDCSNTWETGGLYLGALYFDEFLYLHDTTIIKNIELIDMLFKRCKGMSVSFLVDYNSYLGKYRTEILEKIKIPRIITKLEAIEAERIFNQEYIKADGNVVTLFPELNGWETEPRQIETKHGRQNSVYENEFFIKYKGCWKTAMAK